MEVPVVVLEIFYMIIGTSPNLPPLTNSTVARKEVCLTY